MPKVAIFQNTAFVKILVSLAVAALVCLALFFFLPKGANRDFVSYVLYLLSASTVVLLVFSRKIFKPTASPPHAHPFYYGELLWPLIPCLPIVQYLIANTGVIHPVILALTGLLVFLVCQLFIVALPNWLHKNANKSWLAALFLALSFMMTSMPLWTEAFAWYKESPPQIVLPPFVILAGVMLFLVTRARRFLSLFAVIVFVMNSGYFVFAKVITPQAPQENDGVKTEQLEKIRSLRFKSTPDIYYLGYDAYVINEVMLGYGIDNSSQETYLKNHGFTLYPHTYSKHPYTRATLSKTLQWTNPRFTHTLATREIAGFNILNDTLRANGYQQTVVLDDYLVPYNKVHNYDSAEGFEKVRMAILLSAFLAGEFRDEFTLWQWPKPALFLKTIQATLANTQSPQFYLGHQILPGHSQNSGTCRPNDTARFKSRLKKANSLMRKEVESILQSNKKAIIIIAGDHGPMLTIDCRAKLSKVPSRHQIQDRYGTFLAIRWPDDSYKNYDNIRTHQDIFPAILATLAQDSFPHQTRSAPRNRYINKGIITVGKDKGTPLFLHKKRVHER